MLQLRTVFLCGLNDHIRDELKKEDIHALVVKWFLPLARNHPCIMSGNHHQSINVTTPLHFWKLSCEKLDSDLSKILKSFCIYLMSMNKSKIRKNTDLLNGALNEHFHHGRFSQWYISALDLVEYKI